MSRKLQRQPGVSEVSRRVGLLRRRLQAGHGHPGVNAASFTRPPGIAEIGSKLKAVNKTTHNQAIRGLDQRKPSKFQTAF